MVRPSGSSRNAKPRSMVMPRAFSSGRRSVSVPVSALTSEVLPWSMWPAVPTTTWRRAALIGARGSCARGEPLRRLRAEPAEHAPGARDHGGQRLGEEPERRDRLAGRAVLVRGERPLQRCDRELVDAEGAVPRVLLEPRDDRALAHDDA